MGKTKTKTKFEAETRRRENGDRQRVLIFEGKLAMIARGGEI